MENPIVNNTTITAKNYTSFFKNILKGFPLGIGYCGMFKCVLEYLTDNPKFNVWQRRKDRLLKVDKLLGFR